MAVGGEVLFMNTEYVKRYSNVSESVLDEYFKPILLVVQETVIESYLGTDLYDKLVSDISADTLAGNYLTLHEGYVMKATLWWFLYNFYVDLETKIDNGGVVKRISDDTTDAGNISTRRDQAKKFAQSYSSKLIDYLCENSSLFPEYTSNSGADINPKGLSFITFSNGAARGNYN